MPSSRRAVSTSTMIFILLCANAVIMYVDRTNISIAAPVIKHELGLNNLSVGLAFSAFSIAYAAFMIVGGRLGDIFGARAGLAICGLIWTAGTVATGMVGGLASLVCARFLVGIGEAAVYPISSSVISRWVPRTRRGSAQGLMHGFGRLGAAVAPAVVATLIITISWRAAFIILGVASLAAAGVIWAYLRDDPRLHPGVTPEELERLGHDPRPAGAGSGGSGAAGEIGRSPPMVWGDFFRRVWPVTAVSFCYGWFSWFLLGWVPLYFSHVHGLNLKHVAMFSTMVLIAGFCGNIGGGFATDWWLRRTGSARRARRDVVITGFLGAMLCIVPLLLSANLVLDTVFLTCGYFMIELADASIWMLGMEVLPSHAATSTATVNTGFAIAGTVSPLVVGWLLDRTGGNWDAVFLASIAVLLIGPVVVWRIRFNEEPTPMDALALLQDSP